MQRCAAVLAEFLTAALHAAAGAKSGSGSGLLRLLRGRLLRGRLLGCRILLGLLRNRLLRGRILLGLLGRRSILRLLGLLVALLGHVILRLLVALLRRGAIGPLLGLLGIGILIGLLGLLGIAALLIGIVLIGSRLDRNALICFFAESQQGDEDVGQENQSRRKADDHGDQHIYRVQSDGPQQVGAVVLDQRHHLESPHRFSATLRATLVLVTIPAMVSSAFSTTT